MKKDFHKIQLTKICSQVGVDWVKTSTGFAATGATPEDIQLMVAHVTGNTQVKAAGGIRTFLTMRDYVELGITRCGCTTTEQVLTEAKEFYGK